MLGRILHHARHEELEASLPFNILSVSDDEPSWEEKDLSAPDTGD